MTNRQYRVYDLTTDGLIGEVGLAEYEKYVQDLRQAPGLRGLDGARFGFAGHKIYIPDADDEVSAVYRRWSYEAAVVIQGRDTLCVRPPTYHRGFVRQLHRAVPKAVWCDGKTTTLRKGWWMPGDPFEDVLPLLNRYFPGTKLEMYRDDGTHLGTLELGPPDTPPPPRYESPPEGCEQMHVFLTVDEIRELLDTGETRLYRGITPFPDDHDNLDTDDEQFWATGLGFDVAEVFGRPGEHRWFNEIFAVHAGSSRVAYRADHEDGPPGGGPWQNRNKMTREQARLVATVESITAHRLHDLLPADFNDDRAALAARWDDRKAGEDFPFETNPWVWRVALRRVLPRDDPSVATVAASRLGDA